MGLSLIIARSFPVASGDKFNDLPKEGGSQSMLPSYKNPPFALQDHAKKRSLSLLALFYKLWYSSSKHWLAGVVSSLMLLFYESKHEGAGPRWCTTEIQPFSDSRRVRKSLMGHWETAIELYGDHFYLDEQDIPNEKVCQSDALTHKRTVTIKPLHNRWNLCLIVI